MKVFIKFFLLFILLETGLLGFASASFSQEAKVWTNLGLFGGQINDIAIDPSNPNKMFAATYKGDGLFLTKDGGISWQAVEMNNGTEFAATFKNHMVFAIKIAPKDNNVIWVAHNYWIAKSTDGGETWTNITISSNGYNNNYELRFLRSLAVDPSDPQTVYVGTSGSSGANDQGAIFKTKDGGQTWEQMNQGVDFDFTVVDMDIDPQNSNTIWAVTNSNRAGGVWGGTLYRSGNGGQNWEKIYSLTPYEGAYYAVAVKPDDSKTVFTASEGDTSGKYELGIIKHYFDGNQWKHILPYISDAVLDVSFDPQDPETLYASSPGSIRKSNDAGATWKIYENDYQFRSIAVHPGNREVIFGGDLDLGLYKGGYDSQNTQYTWSSINNGINAVIVYDVAIDPNESTHILAGTISGVYEKKKGENWSRILKYSTYSVIFHPTNSQVIYAGIQGRLAKTVKGGTDWTFSNWLEAYDPDHSNFVVDIAIDVTNTSRIFIAVASSGGSYGEIYKSKDSGKSFEKVLNGESIYGDQYDFNVVAIDPSDPQHIFAGGGNFYAPVVLGDLWESTNGGTDWTRTGLQYVVVNDLIIDPRDSRVMYAGCGASGGTGAPVYRSNDGGVTWTPSHQGIPYPGASITGIWGSSGKDVFAVGSDGNIFHYDGSSWAAMRSSTLEDLRGVWGSSGTDVFAVGNNLTVSHYDGNNWAVMLNPIEYFISGVWGSSGTDVFIVGSSIFDSLIANYNGIYWAEMETYLFENLWDIWGSSGTDVFAVGSIIVHYDGINWTQMVSNTTEWLLGVWGFSGTDVFAVGTGGTILHYNNNSWAPMVSPTTKNLQDVWGTSGTNVFAVGDNGIILHYNGSTWTQMASPTKQSIFSVWGSSGRDVFSGCYDGSILHYDGSSWTVMKPPGKHFNSVTDLEFHPQDKDVIYAGTYLQGAFVSPNKAGKWLNLGKPEYNIFAISTGSLFAGTEGGLFQLTGTGVVTGNVTDFYTGVGINGATVSDGMGVTTICVSGEYMMVVPSGIWNYTASALNYASNTPKKITVYGGEVVRENFSLSIDSDGDRVADHLDNCPKATNPSQTNTDADGLGDACDNDDDNDGMPDDWENQHGLNPLVDDRSGDADNDGYSNYNEYRAGTDPNDPNSLPKAMAMPWIPLLLLDE